VKSRNRWTAICSYCLMSIQFLFAAAIVACLIYALAVLGYWYADAFLFG